MSKYDFTIDELLSPEGLNACDEAKDWAKGKTWQEIYDTCPRGDWLMWLFARANPNDLRKLTLVKGHQANIVRHLMKDDRSKKAVDLAILFGEGKATREDLNNADAAAADADAAAADAAADADAAAYDAADAAAYAADAAYADAYAARRQKRDQTLKQFADICREHLPIEIWNIKA